MNQLLTWLSEGDLRSDGLSSEVAALVLEQPQLLPDLLEGLNASEDVIRGRTADALEKVARTKPEFIVDHLPKLIHVAQIDQVPMVKMHLAMLFGHLAVYEAHLSELLSGLLFLLEDPSVFTKSWAISSLCTLGRIYPYTRARIVDRIGKHGKSDSIAVRTRVQKALNLLLNEETPFPKGWIKSVHIKGLINT